jgi:adenylate kinase
MDDTTPDAVIFIGPQGSGKGTQAQILKHKIHGDYIEMGALLRAVSRDGTEFGREVKDLIESGSLVDDDMWKRVISDKIASVQPGTPIILDGSPRTLNQAHLVLDMMHGMGRKNVHTIHVTITREETMQRLLHRVKCVDCATSAVTSGDVHQRCAVCGGALEARSDDTPEIIGKRLDTYEHVTLPVVGYLETATAMHHVDGMGHVDEVAAAIDSALGV